MVDDYDFKFPAYLSPDNADAQTINVAIVLGDGEELIVGIPAWATKAFRFQREVTLQGQTYYVVGDPVAEVTKSYPMIYFVKLSYYYPPLPREATNG